RNRCHVSMRQPTGNTATTATITHQARLDRCMTGSSPDELQPRALWSGVRPASTNFRNRATLARPGYSSPIPLQRTRRGPQSVVFPVHGVAGAEVDIGDFVVFRVQLEVEVAGAAHAVQEREFALAFLDVDALEVHDRAGAGPAFGELGRGFVE